MPLEAASSTSHFVISYNEENANFWGAVDSHLQVPQLCVAEDLTKTRSSY
jgi:hypothetical protein